MHAFQKFHKSKLCCSIHCTFKILILFQTTLVSRISILSVIFLFRPSPRPCFLIRNCKSESIGELIARKILSASNFTRNSPRIRPFLRVSARPECKSHSQISPLHRASGPACISVKIEFTTMAVSQQIIPV